MSMKSKWQTLTCRVLQKSILGPILFSVFTKGLDEGNKYALCKFKNDVKTGKQFMLERRLEKCVKMNLMKFNEVPW